MHTQKILTCLCEKYTLGKIICDPLPVTGGLLHRMYHVTTDQGEYAIKLLNPDIMKRPKAMSNMIHSERIAAHIAAYFARSAENLSAESPIPVVAALEYSGQHLLSACPSVSDENGHPDTAPPQYALAYPWLDARSLFAPAIGAEHCRKIGHLLGQIHHADFRLEGVKRETSTRSPYDWQGYLAMAGEQKVPWLADYEAMLANLFRWDHAAVDAMETINAFQVISHRDLDPKNILWQGTNPLIIDWE
ncbi:MAG: aminoglycoside phosphotransferase family protein, partial [Acetatifactor sp.]|nr:aminoglycoside phosphotransferase family protein [Acetatifactor sp.]